MPTGLGVPSQQAEDALVQRPEVPWLEPVPDVLVGAGREDPADLVTSRESIRLAFIAALQHLPPRQRAVLILRDVLRWRAAEVAEALHTTTTAVNSSLQRAHAQLARAALTQDSVTEPSSAEQRQLLERYVTAFWDKDIARIVSMLTEDAVWEMPPFTGWYQGAETIGRLIDGQCPGGPHDMRMLPTRANGQPAFGLYMRAGNTFVPFQLQVLTLRGGSVAHVAAFFDPALFERFGLPPSLARSLEPSVRVGPHDALG